MIPLGYKLKRLGPPPEGFGVPGLRAIHAVASCIAPDAVDLDPLWRHNGWWFFDSPALARDAARDADPAGLTLLYCEAFEEEYDADRRIWQRFAPASGGAAVAPPEGAVLSGYDVVSFWNREGPPGCSPLSCNALGAEVRVNRFCLFATLAEARAALNSGLFAHAEPGPYRIIAVHTLAAAADQPSPSVTART